MLTMNPQEENEKRCYTVDEILKILHISRPTAYGLIKKKEFRTVYVGGRHLISKKSFDAWLDGLNGIEETDSDK